jgi:hypothetical protein
MPDGKETSLNARYSPKGLWHARMCVDFLTRIYRK